MKPIEKVWGVTTELFRNNTTSTHVLAIKAGGYCSQHRHAQKTNSFYVISGKLEVVYWTQLTSGSYQINMKTLCPGDSFVLGVGIWHQFRAITNVDCIEIYDYVYDGVDIERRTVGGLETNKGIRE